MINKVLFASLCICTLAGRDTVGGVGCGMDDRRDTVGGVWCGMDDRKDTVGGVGCGMDDRS